MRELLFRGKTKKGEWVKGLLHNCVGTSEVLWRKDDTIAHADIKVNYWWVLCPELPDCIGWDVCNTFTPIEVRPETVGQYMGHTDKNNNKIFEKDIVRINGITYIAQYDDFGCPSFSNIDGLQSIDFASAFGRYGVEEIEIIGNMCDNPELKEGKHGS